LTPLAVVWLICSIRSHPQIKGLWSVKESPDSTLTSGISSADEPQDSLVPGEVQHETQEEQKLLFLLAKMSDSPLAVDTSSDGATHYSDSSKPPAVNTSINDLPEEILALCLSFVGPGQYRYVAGTCHSFRDAHNSEPFRKTFNKEEGEHQKTTWDAVVASIHCAELCLEDKGELQPRMYEVPFVEMITAKAAAGGQVTVLKWLQTQNLLGALDTDMCRIAASNGHLSVLKWLHENDCPWNEQACALAAWNGHLAVLKWLRENDCPWNEEAYKHAAMNGHLPALQWL